MNGGEFFRTRMGQQFYDVTMPKIADGLGSLNTTLHAILVELRALNERANPARDPGAASMYGPTPPARPAR
jgi:hypothetical protein